MNTSCDIFFLTGNIYLMIQSLVEFTVVAALYNII